VRKEKKIIEKRKRNLIDIIIITNIMLFVRTMEKRD